jgi:hypothetical protein
VLRRISGFKREELAGGWENKPAQQEFVLFTKYY